MALLFELERGDGQTDSVPGVCNYGNVPLSMLGNTVIGITQKNANLPTQIYVHSHTSSIQVCKLNVLSLRLHLFYDRCYQFLNGLILTLLCVKCNYVI